MFNYFSPFKSLWQGAAASFCAQLLQVLAQPTKAITDITKPKAMTNLFILKPLYLL